MKLQGLGLMAFGFGHLGFGVYYGFGAWMRGFRDQCSKNPLGSQI